MNAGENAELASIPKVGACLGIRWDKHLSAFILPHPFDPNPLTRPQLRSATRSYTLSHISISCLIFLSYLPVTLEYILKL